MATGHIVLHLDEATFERPAFGPRHGRVGGALGTSIASHAFLIIGILALTRVPPAVQPSAAVASIVPFVIRATTGEGGGGGGGGNRSTEPAVRAQTRPGGAVALAVTAPPPSAAPDVLAPETPPVLPALQIAAQPMDAGQFRQIGTLDGPSAPPQIGQGGGDGGGSDTGRGPGSGPGAGPGQGPGAKGGFGGDVHRIGGDVTSPQIIHKTSPRYSVEAMRAKVSGVAILSGVIGADGTLRDIRIVRSVDGTFGLDQEAIACVREWRFRPATRRGQPVAVYVTIAVAFHLR